MKVYTVYILASLSRTLYVGMTSNLEQRLVQHREKHYQESFTAKYNISRLLYFEEYGDVWQAIAREKEIKKWRREKKIHLIEQNNPGWEDLSEGWF